LRVLNVNPEVRAKLVVVMFVATKLDAVSFVTTRDEIVAPVDTDKFVNALKPLTLMVPVVIALVTFKLFVVVETAEMVFNVAAPVTYKLTDV